APAAYAPAPTGYAPAPVPYAGVAQSVPFPNREGFTIGFALGHGSLSFDDKEIDGDTNVGISLRMGAALTPNFLLQASLESTRASFDDDSAAQLNFFGVTATGYLHPRFYLVGGLGVSSMEILDKNNDPIAETDDELGVLVGLGVEAYQSSGFAVSIELRGIAASFDDKTASGGNVLIGFQWF